MILIIQSPNCSTEITLKPKKSPTCPPMSDKRAIKEYALSVVSVSIFDVSKYTFTTREFVKALAGIAFEKRSNLWEMYAAGK